MVAVSGLPGRASSAITSHSRIAIVVLLVLSVGIGVGIPQVEQTSSLDQFQSETPEGDALQYASANFTSGAENVTSVQVIVREQNVLDKQSLLDQLRFQQTLRTSPEIRSSLVEDQPTVGIANFVATAAIRAETAASLQQRAAALNATAERVNTTAAQLVGALDRVRMLQREFDALNRSREEGTISQDTYEQRAAALRANISAVRDTATTAIIELDSLEEDDAREFSALYQRVRSLQAELDALNESRRDGEISSSEYEQRAGEIRTSMQQAYGGIQAVLAPAYQSLQERASALEADREALLNATRSQTMPPIAVQIEQLESMNASAVTTAVGRVLATDGTGEAVFSFMPTTFDADATSADATMILIRQVSEQSTAGGVASEALTETQLEMRDLARDRLGEETLVFGAGIITDEINRSMTDSLAIVGPLALLFVLVVLVIAYRDPIDIFLGLFGIALVLVWTFGFMGWADIAFNQLFVAVPVLLIGLSIDYAIHVFMRHREERSRGDDDGVRRSMRTALASVGVALTFVTATTVIGFLSNLISSVPPIREFGVVSSVGIVAALLVFGILIPALKVEIDGLLEAWGWNRRKRAFGTGGGRLGSMLRVGGAAARKAPWVVVLLALLVTAGGAWGATNVDTTFDQTDFLADDPPAWMDSLPEPLAPGAYSAKSSLSYVNENFVREDSQAQILIRGDITDPALLDRLAAASDAAAESDVTVTLSNGEADLQSPLSVMRSIAARNESFAALLQEADTDGDGRPDRNVDRIFDAMFTASPTTSQNVLYRTGDGYEAARIVVSIRGSAAGDEVMAEMRSIADDVEGTGVSVIATGQPIVFELVSNDLLDTVIQSLIITLVAVFVFLMITYRFTHGSATLGIVTLLPVAFSVAWILGTMYLLGIPFNVLTGLITSLTVGLGVAYSIHISERYSHELDRTDGRWDAMDRALEGTGGALLGSAATTVGGFGVLVFAILPPLQQFGIITGLTIIYAFLGSVLVLPTFLALWTRYLGPGGEEDASRPAPPTRSLDRRHAAPGGEYGVTLSVPMAPGRTLVREATPGEAISLNEVEPEPLEVAVVDGTIYAVWALDTGTTARLRYTGTLSGTVDEVSFDGVVRDRVGDRRVEGATDVALVEDVFERIIAEGEVTESDVRTAAEAAEAGRLSTAQFERVLSAWVEGTGAVDVDDSDR